MGMTISFGEVLAELGLGSLGLDEGQIRALEEHFGLLVKWNRRMNLTGLVDSGEIMRRHYAESLWLGRLLPPGPLSLADVGSGAGFPGYPIAVLRRDCQVALIESNSRKAVFLRQACRAAGNVRVLEGRAEDRQERFDWLLARGVAWRDLSGLMPRLARSVAVLVGDRSVGELESDFRMAWGEPVRVPWLERGVAMLGTWRAEEGST